MSQLAVALLERSGHKIPAKSNFDDFDLCAVRRIINIFCTME